MRILPLRTIAFFVSSSILLASASEAQQIYKWKDANGQTHYSERKDGASGKPDEVKIKVAPAAPAPAAPAPSPSWKQPSQASPGEQADASSQAPRPQKSLSGGREDGSDASRCALARDVLSGAVRLTNGAKTDKHAREVAENDVRAFCR